MFFELAGTIMAGVATALVVWALNRALKGRFASWIVPVSAGAAMLVATISSEYGWFDRTARLMPQGFKVAQTVEETAFYRPWTYIVPYVTRFVAVDHATMRTHPAHPEQRIVELVFYGRWAKTAKVPMLFNCETSQRADIADGIEFGENGEVIAGQWVPVAKTDLVMKVACEEV